MVIHTIEKRDGREVGNLHGVIQGGYTSHIYIYIYMEEQMAVVT